MLAPRGFVGQIPFLSIGNDVGRRTKVFEGSSKVSGDFVVEDVDVDGACVRRLVFLDNQFLVQSEAKLKTVKAKNKTKTVVDFGDISYYHGFMCVGVQYALIKPLTRVAVLGLGGGGLCMFIKKCFVDLRITAVDLDAAMLEVAKNYFRLQVDERLEVQIKDGLDFLKNEVDNGNRYECLIFDMDSKDRTLGLSCPPKQFLSSEVLDQVDRILGDNGQLILNLVCRDQDLHDSIIVTLKQHFKHIVQIKLFEEVNEIVLASNSDMEYSIEDLENAVKSLNGAARQKNLVNIKCVDLKDFLQSVTVIS